MKYTGAGARARCVCCHDTSLPRHTHLFSLLYFFFIYKDRQIMRVIEIYITRALRCSLSNFLSANTLISLPCSARSIALLACTRSTLLFFAGFKYAECDWKEGATHGLRTKITLSPIKNIFVYICYICTCMSVCVCCSVRNSR